MKTTISITGQPMSAGKLRNAIESTDCINVSSHFNNYTLTFPNKKTAIKALSEGYKSLKTFDPDDTNLYYSRGNSLTYDAGRAVIN
ncbi:MAG: hypothetical protein WC389_20305 [Lutibacter sp.]|jgi:hypothetical protein